jgi:acetyl esterase/lipase
MPAAVIVSSPVIDVSGTLDYTGHGWDDSQITTGGLKSLIRLYCTDERLRSQPYASPVFADFTGFCPLFVSWDRGETLVRDSEKLIELA